MKVIGIIPARFSSSRFPGKPLIDLNGKSMIQRVYEGASKSALLDRVLVATDDQRIVDEVLRFGGEVSMTSRTHATGTDRCGELTQNMEADVIVNIQGDEPLIDARQLDVLCAAFEDPNVQIATLAIASSDLKAMENPNRIKVVTDKNSDALYFSRSPIPNTVNSTPTAKESFLYWKHIGVYAFRRTVLLDLIELPPTKLEQLESLEQLRWMYHGYRIRVVETTIETPNIDTPEDVQKVLALL